VPELTLPSPRAEVRALFVAPEHAGRGVGRALLRAAEGAISASGHVRAYLLATQSGLAFYRSAGYERFAEHAVPIPGGGQLMLTAMVRELSGELATINVA
jgi:GNAT superfamily N-acetyltransferase